MTRLKTADLVKAAQAVIAQYSNMRLTLRQIFYRLVANHTLPNTVSSYKSLGNALVEGRRSGEISYRAMEDRTRSIRDGYGREYEAREYFKGYWDHFRKMDKAYSMPRWWGQGKYVQVWLEKQALSGIFERITDGLGVDLMVCRGYPSESFIYEAAQHLKRRADNGTEDTQKDIVILYFGDFDPSGLDIERDVGDRLRNLFDVEAEIHRVAITREQIDAYNIPPAPAKADDSRIDTMVAEHGVAWQVELDALDPPVLQQMIRDSVEEHFDDVAFEVRGGELSTRRDRIREWVSTAMNPEFRLPPEG